MKFATKLQDLGIEQLKKITPKTAQLAAIIRIFEAVRVLISNQNNID
jgi:DNA polymerase III psi subunit